MTVITTQNEARKPARRRVRTARSSVAAPGNGHGRRPTRPENGEALVRDAAVLERAAARAAEPVTLRVRPATPADAIPLQFFIDTALRRDYFVRRGQLVEMLRGTRHQVWVAEIDTILVGFAVTTRGTRLVNALVHPAYRGLGIGRALVNQTGASEARVKLNMSTGDPRGFYEAIGFQPGGNNGAGGTAAAAHIATMVRRPADAGVCQAQSTASEKRS
ncbi:MAG: GNAT family N-acetyltransferase [Planctomycetota bacterium]